MATADQREGHLRLHPVGQAEVSLVLPYVTDHHWRSVAEDPAGDAPLDRNDKAGDVPVVAAVSPDAEFAGLLLGQHDGDKVIAHHVPDDLDDAGEQRSKVEDGGRLLRDAIDDA